MNSESPAKIAVVIPCYRVKRQILGVIEKIGPEVDAIYVVDDACPESTGDYVEREVRDKRVQVIRCERNGGVGAATLTGMAAAAAAGATILVKVDGDGQMDTALIPSVVAPILDGTADYTKGNRFYSPEFVQGMPAIRIVGNGILSFMTKVSSGYWTIFDPTNGFLAIHAAIFEKMPRQKIASRFFFESDLLFRLNLLRANVVDIPMPATYGDETSNLRIGRVVLPFLWGHLRNCFKRIVYSYFIRDFSIASIYLMFGFPLFLFGVLYGADQWIAHARSGTLATAGTVMVAALPVITGFQLILAFLGYDVATVPRSAVHPLLVSARRRGI
jgi:glycosyltransferase involved in cell wall biosynthesis